MRSFEGCAYAAVASAARIRRLLVTRDPLLRVDPTLQARCARAARFRAVPRVVRFLRLAEHVVDDAEIDQRLGWVATERFELVELVLAERHRGVVHRQPALLIRRRRLVGGRERLPRVARVAGAPLVDRDVLPAARDELADLAADISLELREVVARGGACLAGLAAIVRVGREELRADLRVRALQVGALVALRRQVLEDPRRVARAARVEERYRVREVERERFGALQHRRIAGRAFEVGRRLGRLAFAQLLPAAAVQREREVPLRGRRDLGILRRHLDREVELVDRALEVGVPDQRRPLRIDLGERGLRVRLLRLFLGGRVRLGRALRIGVSRAHVRAREQARGQHDVAAADLAQASLAEIYTEWAPLIWD